MGLQGNRKYLNHICAATRCRQSPKCQNMTGPLPLGTSERVSGVKVLSEVCIENVACWNPGAFLWPVSFPVNQVLQLATDLTGIHNTVDGEGWLASNDTGGRGCFRSRGKRGSEYRE